MARVCLLLVAAVGLFSIAPPMAAYENQSQELSIQPSDPRLAALQRFFRRFRSPLDSHAADFLMASDRHGLDWRLLPGIAMVESGGGRNYIRNNVFGWANGRARFDSISHGIAVVATALAKGSRYAGKDLAGKLKAYNPGYPGYPRRVLWFMKKLPAPPEADTVGQ
jgi:hypothetical protein